MPDPLIVDPELQAEVIRQFNLRGELSPFLLTNRVVPIFDIGRLASLNVPQVVTTTEGGQGVRVGLSSITQFLGVAEPSTDDGDVTDGGTAINPAALAVDVDTGQLAAGTHIITAQCSSNVVVDFRLEWRDAANAVTLASWTVLSGGPSSVPHQWKLNADVLLNERFRIVNVGVVVGSIATNIQATPVFVSFAA